MIRDDISDRLIHLTRGESWDQASKVFLRIMGERKLLGGTAHIRGRYKCICFSEAPIAKLATILADPDPDQMRYAPFGIMLSKTWLYSKGGRPVIYQADDEFDVLPESLKYRHVRYEPHKQIDYTWEREWRLCADELPLDPAETTLVVPSREWERRLREEHAERDLHTSLMSRFHGMPISPFPWHFIVLEDLGVRIPFEP